MSNSCIECGLNSDKNVKAVCGHILCLNHISHEPNTFISLFCCGNDLHYNPNRHDKYPCSNCNTYYCSKLCYNCKDKICHCLQCKGNYYCGDCYHILQYDEYIRQKEHTSLTPPLAVRPIDNKTQDINYDEWELALDD